MLRPGAFFPLEDLEVHIEITRLTITFPERKNELNAQEGLGSEKY